MKEEYIIEQVLDVLREAGGILRLNDIAKSLGIFSDSDEFQKLKRIIKNLVRDGLLLKQNHQRYSLNDYEAITTVEGIIRIKNDRGIVELKAAKPGEITIRRKDLLTALDGDLVRVKLMPGRKQNKPKGSVIDIIKRSEELIYGTIESDKNFYFLIPDEEKHYVDFLIPKSKLKGAEEGDKVSAKFSYWEDPFKSPQAEVVEIIGKAGVPVAEFDSLVRELNLPSDFPGQVKKEADSIPPGISGDEIMGRLDLRELNTFTIDPEDAKDFDDALSVTRLENRNFLVGVHIADVTHYVKENSAVDIEARIRGTSIYLTDRVIPMLPEKLSNELCSLKPNVDRLTMSVMIEFSPRGAVKNYEIRESIINSKRRFSYDEALEIIKSGKGDLADDIILLNELAQTLRKKRFRQGGIDFETYEVRFILDENKFPVDTVMKVPNQATSLIEEFMLSANQIVAAHKKTLAKKLSKKSLPYLYRVHDEPEPGQLKDALNFLRSFIPKAKSGQLNSLEINNLLKQVKNENEKYIVNQVLIRAMAKAIYTPNNIGHYGLGFSDYTHFTSPIRRYPDLIIHRLLKEYSRPGIDEQRSKYLSLLMKDIGQTSTDRERIAIESERESVKLTATILAKKHIGEEYPGIISGVTSFGIFVMVDGIFAEGLVHIRDLTDDYYYYDEKRFCLIGRNKKKVFRIGKKIKIRIIKASIEKRRLDLLYLDDVVEQKN